ncbi:MAG: hypothetical protein LBT86_03375 [Deltaproteobacteria bacterium]|nr:hypothetical protein [Deltaproteobacteria bacterium]
MALILVGIKVFWFRAAGPIMTDNRVSVPVIQVDSPAGSIPVPVSEVSLRPVLEKILGLWGQGLASGDYRPFHSVLSSGWRNQDSPQQLAQAYQPLYPHRDLMEFFPRRGKLVVLESRPLAEASAPNSPLTAIRDTLGPESPWLARGEWRTGRSALGFSLNLVWEDNQWRPVGLRLEAYKPDLRNK